FAECRLSSVELNVVMKHRDLPNCKARVKHRKTSDESENSLDEGTFKDTDRPALFGTRASSPARALSGRDKRTEKYEHMDIAACLNLTDILQPLRKLLLSKNEKTKKATVKLLVLCADQNEIYPYILDANTPAMLENIRTFNSWDVRKEYIHLLSASLDHAQLCEIVFTDDAIAYFRQKVDEKPVMELLKRAVKIGYRTEDQERNIRPLLELALDYGKDIYIRDISFKWLLAEIRRRMFLEDDLDLANKWTQSDDKPRREARWTLALA
ncbi:10348_t:CDS:2, partial [Acaulospora colombiana]